MEDERCEECGMPIGEGHNPEKGMDCETCENYQIDQEVEKDIQKALEELE